MELQDIAVWTAILVAGGALAFLAFGRRGAGSEAGQLTGRLEQLAAQQAASQNALSERLQAPADVAARVRTLIMATVHDAAALDGDRALVVDIDLSILGQPEAVYDEFERNVRREYWWVSRRRFVAGRMHILQSFLARPSIYHWPHFRERYERTARVNLQRALESLSASRA